MNENLNCKKIDLSAPWIIFVNKLRTLFKYDKEVVSIDYDDMTHTVTLNLINLNKAEYLRRALPKEKTFGNVKLFIEVIGKLPEWKDCGFQSYIRIFEGNPVFKYIEAVEIPEGDLAYAVMDNKLGQYYADNLRDPSGMVSESYEKIARDIFGEEDIIFSTIKDYSNPYEE